MARHPDLAPRRIPVKILRPPDEIRPGGERYRPAFTRTDWWTLRLRYTGPCLHRFRQHQRYYGLRYAVWSEVWHHDG